MKHYRFSTSDWMKMKEANRNAFRQQAELSREHLEKIKKHKLTLIIKYPEYREAYDYVDKLFPEANVKKIEIYKCDSKFIATLGYKGIGGFFNRIFQVVVIPDNPPKNTGKTIWDTIKAKITYDEVMVHELLHYVSSVQKKGVCSLEIEEEFAYGNSIGYLSGRGYSDKEIIEHNFMPYLIGVVDTVKITKKVLVAHDYDIAAFMKYSVQRQKTIIKKYEKDIFEMAKKIAFEKGMEIIDIYTKTSKRTDKVDVDDGSNKFNMMDL